MVRRRILVLVAALAATLLVVTAAPAAAIPPLGPVVTVANAPAGCSIDSVNGDATIGGGSVIRGFFNFAGSGCDSDEIWFVGGFGTTWKVLLTPYRGTVLASDQLSGAFVLFSSSTGIYLGERSLGNGTYLSPPRQLSSTAPGAVAPTGAILAGGSNTWWAVWSEQVGPGGEFAQTELFQAKTYGNDLPRTQVTNNPDNDSMETTVGPGGHTYVAWLRDGQVFESDNRSGGFQHKAFVANGLSTDIGVSGGRTRVVWSEAGDGTVLAERLGSGGWTKGTVYPAASRMRPLVLGTTVLMASALRIYARTEIL